jgi:hypothetical protein
MRASAGKALLENIRRGLQQKSSPLRTIERFRVKWKPVRIKKTRQNKDLGLLVEPQGARDAVADGGQQGISDNPS